MITALVTIWVVRHLLALRDEVDRAFLDAIENEAATWQADSAVSFLEAA